MHDAAKQANRRVFNALEHSNLSTVSQLKTHVPSLLALSLATQSEAGLAIAYRSKFRLRLTL